MKVAFETRKLNLQMCNYDKELGFLARATANAWAPLMLRDVLFRFTHLSFFYAVAEVEHKPKLLYTIPQITDFMRQRRQYNKDNGLPVENTNDLSHLFYEIHHYELKHKMTTRLSLLIIANVIATALTNPLDVVLTKLATQQP